MNPLLPISLQQLDNNEAWSELKPFSSNQAMLMALQLWVTVGWIRPLDHAFAAFLVEQKPTEQPAVFLAAALTSYQLSHGHVCLDIEQALSSIESVLSLTKRYEQQPWHPVQLLAQLTLTNWQHALVQSELVSLDKQQAPLVLQDYRLYLWRYWHCEQLLIQHINQRLVTPLATPANLKDQLDDLFKDNKQTPDWQKIACAIASRASFSIITGGPGTGKTTTVIRLLSLLQTPAVQSGTPLNIQLAAPTGKAAARLTESIGKQVASLNLPEEVRAFIPTNVSTIHRLLGSRPDTRHFRHNKTNPLALDILIIDEASMIDLELFAHLLETLPLHARLILLGDKDQLASVEAGAVLGDLCRRAEHGLYSIETLNWLKEYTGEDLQATGLTLGDNKQNPLAQQTVMLRYSRRFSNESGIGQLANHINQGSVKKARLLFNDQPMDIGYLVIQQPQDKSFEQFILTGHLPEDGFSHYLNVLKEQRPASHIKPYDPLWKNWAHQVINAFNQFQLLAVLRDGAWGVKEINQHIAHLLFRHRYISHFDGWYEGRPVMMTHNDYALGLMNGDIGITLAFPLENAPEQTVLKVVFPYNDGTLNLREILPSRLSSAETVYSMTVHKSQGSEFTHTTLLLPDTLNPVLSKELLYTAVTRAKQRFTLIESNPYVFNEAIGKQTNRLSGISF